MPSKQTREICEMYLVLTIAFLRNEMHANLFSREMKWFCSGDLWPMLFTLDGLNVRDGAGCCKRTWDDYHWWNCELMCLRHLRCLFDYKIYLSAYSVILHWLWWPRAKIGFQDWFQLTLCKIPNCYLQNLQRVRNWAAMVISGGKMYCNVSPERTAWLPVVSPGL